jgi:D-lyxose ketol-isomerase
MITRQERDAVLAQASAILTQAGVHVREDEIAGMEVADFGLSEIEISGTQIVTLVDTDRIAAKLLVMLPYQTEPEHKHPPLDVYPGKQETIRCEWGTLYLYAPGDPTPNPQAQPPAHRKHTYTVWHEYVLQPGDQVTFPPNTPHWFQGGPQGAVIWSFSTKAIDVQDIFTDPDVQRETVIGDDED